MSTEQPNTHDVAAELADLRMEMASLRRSLTGALALLLVLTLALNGVFLWQSRIVRRQLSTARTEWGQYQKNVQPMIDQLLSRLQSFAATNSDFRPVLSRFTKVPTNAVAIAKP
jgi:hypothetical protein